jgi:hypothetical protein
MHFLSLSWIKYAPLIFRPRFDILTTWAEGNIKSILKLNWTIYRQDWNILVWYTSLTNTSGSCVCFRVQ